MKFILVLLLGISFVSEANARKRDSSVKVAPKCGSLWSDTHGGASGPGTPGSYPVPGSSHGGLKCTISFLAAPGGGNTPVQTSTLEGLFRTANLTTSQQQVISSAHAAFMKDFEQIKKQKLSRAEGERRINESLARHVASVERALKVKVERSPVEFSK